MKCESHTFNTDVKALYLCQPGDGNKYFVCGLIITFEAVCIQQDLFLDWGGQILNLERFFLKKKKNYIFDLNASIWSIMSKNT